MTPSLEKMSSRRRTASYRRSDDTKWLTPSVSPNIAEISLYVCSVTLKKRLLLTMSSTCVAYFHLVFLLLVPTSCALFSPCQILIWRRYMNDEIEERQISKNMKIRFRITKISQRLSDLKNFDQVLKIVWILTYTPDNSRRTSYVNSKNLVRFLVAGHLLRHRRLCVQIT